MKRCYILAARRTAVIPRNGAFKDLALQDLAQPVIAQLLEDTSLSANQIDELIVANTIGPGGNPARVCALASGLPRTVAGLTIDRQCVGGLGVSQRTRPRTFHRNHSLRHWRTLLQSRPGAAPSGAERPGDRRPGQRGRGRAGVDLPDDCTAV